MDTSNGEGLVAKTFGVGISQLAIRDGQLQGQQSMMSMGRSFSFPKARRLTRASEYERVKREGLVRRGKLLTLSAAVVDNSGPCRVGLITSRRVGGAVVGNRVRRRVREIVRRHQYDLRQGVWI